MIFCFGGIGSNNLKHVVAISTNNVRKHLHKQHIKIYKYAGHDSTKGICCNDYRKKTAVVNFGKPNELGLYGMTGNIWELCQDWYAPYCSETQTNPQGPESPLYEWHGRVCRGGSWSDYSWCISVSRRRLSIPTGYDNTLGVRLVLNVINQETCENDSLF